MERRAVVDSMAIWVSGFVSEETVRELVLSNVPYTFTDLDIHSRGTWVWGQRILIVTDLPTGDVFVLTLLVKDGYRAVKNG